MFPERSGFSVSSFGTSATLWIWMYSGLSLSWEAGRKTGLFIRGVKLFRVTSSEFAVRFRASIQIRIPRFCLKSVTEQRKTAERAVLVSRQSSRSFNSRVLRCIRMTQIVSRPHRGPRTANLLIRWRGIRERNRCPCKNSPDLELFTDRTLQSRSKRTREKPWSAAKTATS